MANFSEGVLGTPRGKVADKKQKAYAEEEKPWLFNIKYQKNKGTD